MLENINIIKLDFLIAWSVKMRYVVRTPPTDCPYQISSHCSNFCGRGYDFMSVFWAFLDRKWRMMQNGNENPKFQLWETFYGHIRFQHYHIYQKTCVRKRSMQPVDILGGLIYIIVFVKKFWIKLRF